LTISVILFNILDIPPQIDAGKSINLQSLTEDDDDTCVHEEEIQIKATNDEND
jgi:hypothetical protein